MPSIRPMTINLIHRKLPDRENTVRILELYHGKTIAFKDMALSILPYLLTKAAKIGRG